MSNPFITHICRRLPIPAFLLDHFRARMMKKKILALRMFLESVVSCQPSPSSQRFYKKFKNSGEKALHALFCFHSTLHYENTRRLRRTLTKCGVNCVYIHKQTHACIHKGVFRDWSGSRGQDLEMKWAIWGRVETSEHQ